MVCGRERVEKNDKKKMRPEVEIKVEAWRREGYKAAVWNANNKKADATQRLYELRQKNCLTSKISYRYLSDNFMWGIFIINRKIVMKKYFWKKKHLFMNRRRFHEKSILTFFVYRFLKNEIRLFSP